MALQPVVLQSASSQNQNLYHFSRTIPSTFTTNLGGNRFPFFLSSSAKSVNKKPAQACLSSTSPQEARRLAHFPPTVWGNRFSSFNFNHSVSALLITGYISYVGCFSLSILIIYLPLSIYIFDMHAEI